MKSLSLSILFALLSILVMPHAQAQSNAPSLMQPGLWEVTIQMVAPTVAPATTSTVCISAEEAQPRAPKAKEKNDCRVLNLPAQASEVAYSVNCSKSNRSTTAKFTYYGDRYEGSATTKEFEVEVRLTYAGKRIGACEPVSANAAEAGEQK
jgi:hypothetical protein